MSISTENTSKFASDNTKASGNPTRPAPPTIATFVNVSKVTSPLNKYILLRYL